MLVVYGNDEVGDRCAVVSRARDISAFGKTLFPY